MVEIDYGGSVKQRKRRKNIVAKDLHSPKYKMRVEKQKKGKGSFDRNKVKREDDE